MKKLEVKNISKSFDGRKIIENVNMTLHPGEIIALLGVSGGGKTTLFNIIAGLTAPDEGDVLLDDESIIGQPGRISYMLQKDLLLPHKTVIDNIALPLVIRGTKKKEAREIASKHLGQFGLSGYEKKHPAELSGGMRQRAALLRTFLFSGEVTLLDEPFSALDTITRSSMHIWYLSVMEELKIPTILITHDVDEAILLSDRICILSRMNAQPSEAGASVQGSDMNEAAEGISVPGADAPATISHIITIENRPQKNHEYLLTEDFLQYKRQIIDLI
ncbi:MAG: ABC transporter ATP-binding protein [Eubacterium sp.]|nr:ABC transporter ATP-binding protein [Eubacterium sp.]